MGLALRARDLVVETGGRTLLRAPRFAADPGELIAVSGPSGAGKSTLLFALAGLIPAAGVVRWGDVELSGLSDGALAAFRRRNLGFVFQDHLLFEELSALGNASVAAGYAPADERPVLRRRAAELFARFGLEATGMRGVDRLSGGERQRVAVARALAGDPLAILADEPTASLDREAADQLIDVLASLARDEGRTVIVVSHDAALHARATRVAEIVDGALRPEPTDA